MNKQESIALITAFRDFCLTRGSDAINHHSLKGWDGCAVGEYTKTRADFDSIPNTMFGKGFDTADKLCQAYAVVLPGVDTIQDYADCDTAEQLYPSYDKLAQALTHDLKAFEPCLESA